MQPMVFRKPLAGSRSRVSRMLITWMLFLSILAAVLAPFGAFSWRNQPFAGFLLEPTLVIANIQTDTIQAERAGIHPPMHVLRIAGTDITSTRVYNQALRQTNPGDLVSVTTLSRDGIVRVHPELRISRFPGIDFIKLFWLPYTIGLVYLVCGIWIYRMKSRTTASDALAFFFFTVAIICLLLFDLYTTHSGSTLWLLAMAAAGSALLTLVFEFPMRLRWTNKAPALRYLAFAASFILAVWGIWSLHFSPNPWAYFENWFAIFRYTGLGIILLAAKIVWIAFRGRIPQHRTQARIILLGTFFGFLPLNYFFLAPVLGIEVQFNTLYLLPSLVVFPLSIIFAISKYRLLSTETLINRAVTFGVITTILAGLFPATIKLFQDIFFSITGQKNETAVFVTTFVLVALVEPIKRGVQNFVAGKSKEKSLDDLMEYKDKGFPVNAVFDVAGTCEDLLTQSATALGVENAAIRFNDESQSAQMISIGRWPAEVKYYLPIISHNEQHLGHLFIGEGNGEDNLTQEKLSIISELARSLGDILYLNQKIRES